MRLALTIFASNEWICNSIDIKSAFLQGKQIDRTVFLIPPPEFQEPNVIWKLNTCIYGLSDASRSWYLRVKEELCNLGVQCSRVEPSLFFWHFNNRLEGLLISHVDDFCWGRTDNFKNKVIDPLKTVFAIGTEFEKTFKYLGLNITQKKKYNINIDKIQFIDEINQIEISRERTKNKSDKLTDDELKSYRTLIGQLSWAANRTRPDISFSICELSSAVKNATVDHLLQANKVLKNIQDQKIILTFPRMQNMQDCTFVTYSDSSFNNLDNGGSQGGFIIFLTDNIGNS